VRLVALNRAGYGTSSWDTAAGFKRWASDAGVVLDLIGVDDCAVLGASGGAPYALAFAAAHAPRVTRVGLAAGVGPPTVAGMDRSAVFLAEPRSDRLRTMRYAALAAGYRAGLGTWLEKRMLAALADPDRSALADGQARSVLHRVVDEAFAQRGRAAAHEAGLLLRPWDVDLALVDRPVRVWHGSLDTRVPVGVAAGMAALLPHASATIWDGHGHFSWATSDAVVEVAAALTQ
jgi:pimeloyl-ACP methyl ester carboxylesterase